MFILGLHYEAFVNSTEKEKIMITENGRTRLEPGEQEKFFRKPDGRIIMLAQPNCGAMRTVNLIDQHSKVLQQRFRSGWPKGHPGKVYPENIWDALSGISFPA